MESNNNQFLQFSDQLRHQATDSLANLALNDSIWSNSYATKRTSERRNFDVRVGAELSPATKFASPSPNPHKPSEFNSFNDGWNGFGAEFASPSPSPSPHKPSEFNSFSDGWNGFKRSGPEFNSLNVNDGWNSFKPKTSDFNGFNDWKMGNPSAGLNGGFNKGIYSKSVNTHNINNDFGFKSYKKGGKNEDVHGGRTGKKGNNGNKKNNSENNDNKESKNGTDKRFKTLPPSESLPRNETVGGYIFVCNNDTMQENLKRQLFGLPPRYRDSVRAITPGLPLFLYNYSTHQLHGIFEAASFGGSNIDPTAWEDKKCAGESRFPAQVKVVTRKICEPLEEDSFRPILHHYDGPKFRLELNIPEALSLLDIFAEKED